MKTISMWRLSVTAALALVIQSAQSEVLATLTYLEPTGTASVNDAIPMWVRLSLDPASEALRLGNQPNRAYINWYCDDGGFSECGMTAPAYKVDANFRTSPSWFEMAAGTAFDLLPGASLDLLLFTLVPRTGEVSPGLYEHTKVSLGLYLSYLPHSASTSKESLFMASTSCEITRVGCTFSRTITAAVPEPGTSLLSAAGGFTLWGLAARRRRQTI